MRSDYYRSAAPPLVNGVLVGHNVSMISVSRSRPDPPETRRPPVNANIPARTYKRRWWQRLAGVQTRNELYCNCGN